MTRRYNRPNHFQRDPFLVKQVILLQNKMSSKSLPTIYNLDINDSLYHYLPTMPNQLNTRFKKLKKNSIDRVIFLPTE